MDWVSLLIIGAGAFRLLSCAYLFFAAYISWHNPHPIGRRFLPELAFAMALMQLNDGFRSIGFVMSSAPLADYITQEGLVNLVLSNLITFILCIMVFFSTRKMVRDFVGGLK